MEKLLAPRPSPIWLRKFKHHPFAVTPTVCCVAVKIAGSIEDHAAIGSVSILGVVEEAVQSLVGPAVLSGHQKFEHRSVASSAIEGCAIKIAGVIEDQASEWFIRVLAVGVEAIQNVFRPALVGQCQLEHRSAAVCAAKGRCAVEIA